MLGDQRADPLLVGRVGVGVEEADAEAADAVLDQLADRGKRCRLVDRLDLAAVEAEPPGNLANEMKRHQPLRLHPEERVAVTVRHRLARDLDHVAEAARHQKAEPGELVLEDGIGGDGRAVQEHAHVFRRPLEDGENLFDAVEQSEAGVGRCRRRLHRGHLAGRLVDGDHIRERSASVDGDPEPHFDRRPYIHNMDTIFTSCTFRGSSTSQSSEFPSGAGSAADDACDPGGEGIEQRRHHFLVGGAALRRHVKGMVGMLEQRERGAPCRGVR